MRGSLVVLWLLVASVAHAQPKPIGLFGVRCDVPAWASFGQLADWDDFEAAADCSARTGLKWVLALHKADYDHVEGIRARAIDKGLAPYVLALTYREEPYQHYFFGLDLPPALRIALDDQPDADPYARIRLVRDHWSAAHATIKAVWPGPLVAWITPFVNDYEGYGPLWYAPLPDGVDVLVLDPYASDAQSFTDWPEVAIQHAVNTTTLPIAIVPQWFAAPGTAFSRQRVDFTAHYARWYAHPRVVAFWGFLWESRATTLGLKDLPALRAAVEARIP